MARVTAKQAIVNGASIYYEMHGPSDAPAVVTLHGAPGVSDCRAYVQALGALADEFLLLFYDARGSGRSEELRPYTHEQWVADLDELTRQVGIEEFALLGHSYGGIVAQEYVVTDATRVRQLILVDTTATSVAPQIDEDWVRKLFGGRVESEEEMRVMNERLLPLSFGRPLDPAQVTQIVDDTHFHVATHNETFMVNHSAYDVRDRLPLADVPTLVVCGGKDPITPLSRHEEIAALIPNSRLVVFPDSGHMPFAEESERFERLLRGFLREAAT